MEVFLIRHTRPDIETGLIYGRLDVPLSETFEHEKDAILKQLPASFDGVFSSPSQRCIKLAEALSTSYITDQSLYEMDFGLWESKTWDTINRADSEFWMADFINRCPPDGETLGKMRERVLSFWQKLNTLKMERVAVITHKGVIRIILSELNNTPYNFFFDIKVGYGEIFQIKF